MAATDLEQEIRREIDREIETLVRQAREEGEALLKRTHEECDHRRRQARQQLHDQMAMRRRRALSRAELEAKNLLLRVRREEIDRLFDDAGRRLEELRERSPREFADLLWAVYLSCRDMIPGQRVRVRLGSGTAALSDRLEMEEGVEIETGNGFTGLMVESYDGHVHCDGSLSALLKNLRQDKEAELETILFGERPDDDH